METQNTIKTLKQEFDVLLKELAQYKHREEMQKQAKTTKPKGPPQMGVPSLNLGGQQKPGIPKLGL